MNRLANIENEYQNIKKHKRVLCVCSAGLLRSPTAALVLSQDPYNFNTRAAGLSPEYALVLVDDVLLKWADEIVCMEAEQKYQVEHMIKTLLPEGTKKTVYNLDIPDKFSYRNKELICLIKDKYESVLEQLEEPIGKKMNNLTVGTVVRLQVPCLGNEAGTLGVGFNDYEDGCQFIFENGDYDGFSLEEQENYLEFVRIEPSLINYKFINVVQVSRDYQDGIFNKGFK